MPKASQVLQGMRDPSTWMTEPGLESPPEQKLLQNLIAALSGATLPGAALGAGKTLGVPALQGLQGLGEAGAIFPAGSELPKDIGLAKEMLTTLTPSEQNFQAWKTGADWHAGNYDWPAVLKDKWGMLKHMGGN